MLGAQYRNTPDRQGVTIRVDLGCGKLATPVAPSVAERWIRRFHALLSAGSVLNYRCWVRDTPLGVIRLPEFITVTTTGIDGVWHRDGTVERKVYR